VPEQVSGGPWSAVAVGDAHVCALDSAGTASCWGDNAYGELGQNDQTPRATPTKVAEREHVDRGDRRHGPDVRDREGFDRVVLGLQRVRSGR
jgi:hypothetical protein